MSPNNLEALGDALDLLMRNYVDLSHRLIAVEMVCAKLVQEVALANSRPEQTLLRITSEIRGTADAIAFQNNDLGGLRSYDPSALTRAIERLCEMADGRA